MRRLFSLAIGVVSIALAGCSGLPRSNANAAPRANANAQPNANAQLKAPVALTVKSHNEGTGSIDAAVRFLNNEIRVGGGNYSGKADAVISTDKPYVTLTGDWIAAPTATLNGEPLREGEMVVAPNPPRFAAPAPSAAKRQFRMADGQWYEATPINGPSAPPPPPAPAYSAPAPAAPAAPCAPGSPDGKGMPPPTPVAVAGWPALESLTVPPEASTTHAVCVNAVYDGGYVCVGGLCDVEVAREPMKAPPIPVRADPCAPKMAAPPPCVPVAAPPPCTPVAVAAGPRECETTPVYVGCDGTAGGHRPWPCTIEPYPHIPAPGTGKPCSNPNAPKAMAAGPMKVIALPVGLLGCLLKGLQTAVECFVAGGGL